MVNLVCERRRVLRLGVGSALGIFLAPKATRAMPSQRVLTFLNLHTGEKLSATYWTKGRYLPEALQAIDRVLRDHRTGEAHSIDPALLDLLVRLRLVLDTAAPYYVISGYRSPRTNAMLASVSSGVAENSLHTRGLAIDIRVPGRSLEEVRNAALRLRGGAVGFYAASDFVHLDVGRIRRW